MSTRRNSSALQRWHQQHRRWPSQDAAQRHRRTRHAGPCHECRRSRRPPTGLKPGADDETKRTNEIGTVIPTRSHRRWLLKRKLAASSSNNADYLGNQPTLRRDIALLFATVGESPTRLRGTIHHRARTHRAAGDLDHHRPQRAPQLHWRRPSLHDPPRTAQQRNRKGQHRNRLRRHKPHPRHRQCTKHPDPEPRPLVHRKHRPPLPRDEDRAASGRQRTGKHNPPERCFAIASRRVSRSPRPCENSTEMSACLRLPQNDRQYTAPTQPLTRCRQAEGPADRSRNAPICLHVIAGAEMRTAIKPRLKGLVFDHWLEQKVGALDQAAALKGWDLRGICHPAPASGSSHGQGRQT